VRPVVEIDERILPVEPMKEFPSGVAEIEKRLSIRMDEVPAIFTDSQAAEDFHGPDGRGEK